MPAQTDVIQPKPRAMARAAVGLGLLALACTTAATAQVSATTRQEIDALLLAVGTSGCEFMRSGTAHNAAKAQLHLREKFEYLDMRNQLNSAEDFIVKAGTRSSMTGEAYAIRCANTPQQSSADWLNTRLKLLRMPAGPAMPKR